MNSLDLYTGIGGFVLAGERVGIKTIFTSETDSFNKKFIDRNLKLENAGDVRQVCISQADHEYASICESDDLVPVEKTGISSLCIEDFYEGVLPFPDIITGGFPCVDVSQANLHGKHKGIEGESSGLVYEQLRIIEALEPQYCVFENAKNLTSNGLSSILALLDDMGYSCQWATISATSFGYTHYRHRTYMVAYLDSSAVSVENIDIFNSIKEYTNNTGDFDLPLANEDPEWIKSFAVAEEPRSIHLRTKRINSLGNAIIPDIAEAIFRVIKGAEGQNETKIKLRENIATHSISDTQIFSNSTGESISKLGDSGHMANGELYNNTVRDTKLNPTNTAFKGLMSTLISRDGNNNFTCKSRLSRPGKLGGLVGDIMALGVEKGGLNPEFCEWYMGYDIGYTELKSV